MRNIPGAFAAFVATIVAGIIPASSAAQEPIAVAPTVVVDPPARPVQFEGGVIGYQGLTYDRRPGYRALTLDLYLPPRNLRRASNLPLVIYVHGGGWMGGSPRLSGAMSDFPAVLAALARRGYVVASLSYRFSSEAKFPAQPIDIRSGIRWLKDHSAQYGIDAARTAIWGASAGGQLAALAATACAHPAFDGGRVDPNATTACVQGAVVWYGVFDFSTIAAQAAKIPGAQSHRDADSGEARYLGCPLDKCPPELLSLASPIAHVDSKTPPMLLIAGINDQIVPPDQSRTMANALEKVGASHELLLIPGVNHSFIGGTPAQTRAATVEAVTRTFQFFDRVLKRQ